MSDVRDEASVKSRALLLLDNAAYNLSLVDVSTEARGRLGMVERSTPMPRLRRAKVEPGRVELPSKRATTGLSTCLFFDWVFDRLPGKDTQRTA